MSERSTLSTISIILLIAGLIVGGSVGYFFTSSLYQPRITEQETQIEDLGSQIRNLTTRVEGLEAEKGGLEGEISGYEEAVSAFEDQISDFEGEISAYESIILDLEARIERLLSVEEGLPDIIEDYEGQISELEQRIDFIRSILVSYMPETIQIGITASGFASMDIVQAVVNITQQEINAYREELDFPSRFEFVILDNGDDADEAVENTIWFNSKGINLIVGHPRSQECSLSLNYVNDHDMMLLSPGATSRSLTISDDNLYRTSPSELYQTVVIAETLDSMGIEAIIVVQRDDEWGDDIYSALKTEFETRGGVVYERIEYDPEDPKFISVLNRLETATQRAIEEYGSSGVAIQVISSDEASSLIKDADVFPSLASIKWFGTNTIANRTNIFKSVAQQAGLLKLFSPVPIPEKNGMYTAFAREYRERMGTQPDFYTSALYDACWLYALTVLEVWTTDTDFVEPMLPEIAESYVGASGLLRLNEHGDREVVDFEIWGYRLEGDQVASERYGYYDASEGHIILT